MEIEYSPCEVPSQCKEIMEEFISKYFFAIAILSNYPIITISSLNIWFWLNISSFRIGWMIIIDIMIDGLGPFDLPIQTYPDFSEMAGSLPEYYTFQHTTYQYVTFFRSIGVLSGNIMGKKEN